MHFIALCIFFWLLMTAINHRPNYGAEDDRIMATSWVIGLIVLTIIVFPWAWFAVIWVAVALFKEVAGNWGDPSTVFGALLIALFIYGVGRRIYDGFH